jgi:hypothetical protein
MTPAQIEEATALAEVLREIFLRAPKPAPDAAFDDITDNTLTRRIKLLQ